MGSGDDHDWRALAEASVRAGRRAIAGPETMYDLPAVGAAPRAGPGGATDG